MNTTFVYVARQFFYRIAVFLGHWYVRSARLYSNFVLGVLERLDYYLAWKITLRHLFEPLYKDYSPLGYILGFGFRMGRLMVASFVYLLVFLTALALYFVWLLTPPYLVYLIIR